MRFDDWNEILYTTEMWLGYVFNLAIPDLQEHFFFS